MSIPGLIAGIGATNARFAIADQEGIRDEQILKCRDHPSLAEAITKYMEITGQEIHSASIAIAGPVEGDKFEMTNHPWRFSVTELKATLSIESFHIINDFVAIAKSIPHLTENTDYTNMTKVQQKDGASIGVLGPGTGLGMASLVPVNSSYITVPGEGGHMSMAAKTQREFDVINWLLEHKYSHVSAERVCSGKGLVNIHNALCGLSGEKGVNELSPSEISDRALNKECDLCEEALDLMFGFLGTAAGNLALTIGAKGGIYIAGGIVQKLDSYIYNSRFMEQFVSKGRFKEYMSSIPVFIVTHEFPAFIGLQADLMEY